MSGFGFGFGFSPLGALLNQYDPADDADVTMLLNGRSGLVMNNEIGDDVSIATPVAVLGSNSSCSIPSAGLIMTTDSFAIEMLLNITSGSTLIRQNGGYATAVPGYTISTTNIQISSPTSVIFNSAHNLNLINQGWVHVFVVFNRTGFLDAYRNGVRVLHTDISAKAAESITNAHAYFAVAGTNNFVGQLSYIRFYKFTSGVPADIATYIASNYTAKKVNTNLLTDLTHNFIVVPGTQLGVALVDCKTDSVNYAGMSNTTIVYSNEGSQYVLDYGYSLIRTKTDIAPFTLDIYIPLLMSGDTRTVGFTNLYEEITAQEYLGDYLPDISHPGLLGYKLRFTDNFFDRSNATIWGDAARSSFGYDAANVKDFHPSELNQRTLTEWLNDGYKGRLFVKFQSTNYLGDYFGSVEAIDRVKLLEVFLCATNKTGTDHFNALKYTGDDRFVCYSGSAIAYLNNQCQIGYLQSTKPMFTIRMDDGLEIQGSTWKTVYDALEVNVSVCLLTDLIGTTGFITWAKALELSNDGWEIYSHGADDDDLATKTHAQIDAIIPASKAEIISNGITPCANFTPHKYGQKSLYVRKVAMQHHRSCHAGYSTAAAESANPNKITIDNLYAMRGDIAGDFIMSTPEGIAALKAQIDICAEENRWGIYFYHTGTVEAMQEIVAYVKSKNVEVLTLNQALDACKYLP